MFDVLAGAPNTVSVLDIADEQNGASEYPFVGLRPFEARDEPVFFGRREQTAELLKRLEKHRFVAVLGGSGSGKSSLIKAGLIPVVKRGFLVDDRLAWCQITMRPGQRPLETFADALEKLACATGPLRGYFGPEAPARSAAPDDISSGSVLESLQKRRYQSVFELLAGQTFPVELHQGDTIPERIGDEPVRPSASTAANLLLVIDQFEEVFRYTLSDPNQSAAHHARTFVDLLLKLAVQDGLRVFVVTTMRADFIGACEAFPGLTAMMNKGMYLVPRLTRPQLKEAIQRPMQRKGGSISTRLLDHLLNECTDQPQGSRGEVIDQLPLLQHALMRTWNQWKHEGAIGDIDLTHYQGAGTMQDALARHLDDEVWTELSTGKRDLVERLFRALTDTDTANRQIRRPTRLSELQALTGAPRAVILQALSHFSGRDRSFVAWEAGVDDPIVDICHESLIRKWTRLSTWATDEAAEAVVYGQLVQAAAVHASGGLGEKGLWTDPMEQPQFASALQLWRDDQVPRTWAMRLRLPREAEMLGWDVARSYREAMAFLDKSRRAFEAKKVALEQRQARRWYGLIAAASLIIVITAAVAYLWSHSTGRLIAAGVVPMLVQKSAADLSVDPNKAVLLAAEAVRRASEGSDPANAGLAFHNLEQALRGGIGEFAGSIPAGPEHHGSRLLAFVQAPQARYVIDQTGKLFAVDGDELTSVPAMNHPGTVTNWATSMMHVGRGFKDGSVVLQSLSTPFEKTVVRAPSAVRVSALELSPDGRWAVIGNQDGSLLAWDAHQRGTTTLLEAKSGGGAVHLVRFLKDGMVAADESGHLRQWNIADGAITKATDPPVQSVSAMNVSTSGTWLVRGRIAKGEASRGVHTSPQRIRPPEIWSFIDDGRRWIQQPAVLTAASPTSGQKPVAGPSDEENIPTDLMITPNHKWVLAVLLNTKVLAYPLNHRTDQEIPRLQDDPIEILSPRNDVRSRRLRVSANGRWLAILSDQDVHLIDLEALGHNARFGEDISTRIPHTSDVLFTADNQWMFVALSDGSVRRWRLEGLGAMTRPPIDGVSTVVLDQGGRVFTTGTKGGQVLLTDLADGSATPTSVASNDRPIVTLALSRGGERILAGDESGKAKLLEIVRGRHEARAVEKQVAAAQFSADGLTLWTSDRSGRVTGWPMASSMQRDSQPRESDDLFKEEDTRYSPPTLAVGGNLWILVSKPNDKGFSSTRFLDASSLREFYRADDFRVLTVSPDGRFVVTTGGNDGAELIEIQRAREHGTPTSIMSRHTLLIEATPSAAAFSPDGKFLGVYEPGIGVSTFSTAMLDAVSREDRPLTPGPINGSRTLGQIQTMAVSAGGRWLMTADVKGQIFVFDLQTAAVPLKFPRMPSDKMVALAVFADNTLITVSDQGVARRWDLTATNQNDLVQRASKAVGRNLRCDEWKETFSSMPYKRTFSALPWPEQSCSE